MNRAALTTTLLTFLFTVGLVNGQTKKPFFIGMQPGVTIEPFYQEGEFDVNAFPLVVELSIGSRVNLRILPTLNYHLGGMKNGISDVGSFVVLPIFFKKREQLETLPFGFYVGPVIGFGRNLINNHYTTTTAIEPGYFFETKKRFTVSLGLQLGGSYFMYDSQPNKWIFHWGPKVSLGVWINNTNG